MKLVFSCFLCSLIFFFPPHQEKQFLTWGTVSLYIVKIYMNRGTEWKYSFREGTGIILHFTNEKTGQQPNVLSSALYHTTNLLYIYLHNVHCFPLYFCYSQKIGVSTFWWQMKENSSWGNIAVSITIFCIISVHEHLICSQSFRVWDQPVYSQRQRISNFNRHRKIQESCTRDSSWSYWRSRIFFPELFQSPFHF